MELYLVVQRPGSKAGVQVRLHRLQHPAITRATDLIGGDIRNARRFSRHKDVRVLQRYDDNRQDLAGEWYGGWRWMLDG
jgi:integrase/recombinase XerC